MRAGIAMGSNVGDRLDAFVRARDAVLAIPGVSGPCLCSSLYETEPVGTEPGAERFLNAVIEVGYNGLPATLLEELQGIEASMGRPSKRPRNAPRTIDLDILYVGNLTLSTTAIVIPHPRLHLRRFVLEPLAEIRPSLRLPGQQLYVGELLHALEDPADVQRLPVQWHSLA
jgi:2-amino-4-hydroxy-6-hydroxymethyldihydropteridine diphosphokinase